MTVRRWAPRAIAVVAALVVVTGSAVVVVAGLDQRPETLVAAGPTAAPAPSASPSPECSTTAPPPRDHALPPAQPGPDGSYPRDSRIEVSLDASCTTVRVGERLLLRMTASGDSATPSRTGMTIDGLSSASSASCTQDSDDPAPPEPGTTTEVFEHVYTEPKTDRISVTVGHQCSYYQGFRTAELVVTVLPGDGPAPPPSPEPEVASVPEPAPTPTAPPPSPAPAAVASYPPYGQQDITLVVRTTPESPQVGEPWSIEVTVTGNGDTEPFLQEPVYPGEGGAGFVVFGCAAPEDPSPPPRREHRFTKTFGHTFTTPGRHEVQLRAESACSYYRGLAEQTVVVQVRGDEPTPTPTA